MTPDLLQANVRLGIIPKAKELEGFLAVEKRLPAEIIENVLRDGLNEEEEIKIAARFFKKRKTAVGDWKEKQKLAQILRAKGFRTAVVAKMLD